MYAHSSIDQNVIRILVRVWAPVISSTLFRATLNIEKKIQYLKKKKYYSLLDNVSWKTLLI